MQPPSELRQIVDRLGRMLAGHRLKILVVDDEEYDLIQIKKAIAELADHEVYLVKTGKAALELVRQIQFDLILLDLRMQEMDGLDVIRKLKEARNRVPVLSMSGLENGPLVNQAVKLGVWMHLQKPVDADKLKPILAWQRPNEQRTPAAD